MKHSISMVSGALFMTFCIVTAAEAQGFTGDFHIKPAPPDTLIRQGYMNGPVDRSPLTATPKGRINQSGPALGDSANGQRLMRAEDLNQQARTKVYTAATQGAPYTFAPPKKTPNDTLVRQGYINGPNDIKNPSDRSPLTATPKGRINQSDPALLDSANGQRLMRAEARKEQDKAKVYQSLGVGCGQLGC